ncbi:MAG: bifunctional phosphopantothenoylcysteine decarboxylase/phosphopantothenate--cysteine ligase CoaBC [Myxococcales bacterium]|nr:bifunctional phosphopantothenoylcysteine decarboxylase/phosphopantothenate--cysteine ligase CoaBC [Myxococcales bacterium]
MFQGKEILLGVSGSIAAYKAAEFARLLVKAGANVQVVMTRSACEFISPLTFFSLTNREAYSEMFSGGAEVATAHIQLARRADLVVVAPATARTIARIANGSAEDLLSTSVIASHSPVVLAPAMNPQMYAHPGVRGNLERIGGWENYWIASPSEGEMACGETGLGRLAEPQDLLDFCGWVLGGGRQDLRGEKLVVTAGPTFEDLDPVRFLSNRSTGKMGYAIAKVAAQRGASVKLITAVRDRPLPPGCIRVEARSAAQMAEAVQANLSDASALVMSAAVADYRPAEVSTQKMKKTEGPLMLELARNIDILASLPASTSRVTVGFAAETENLLDNAQGKLKRKRLDMIVGNDVTQKGSGFGTDTNQVILLELEKEPVSLPLMGKEEVAHAILDRVSALLKKKREAV